MQKWMHCKCMKLHPSVGYINFLVLKVKAERPDFFSIANAVYNNII